MLGRDAHRDALAEAARRLLLLTDGQLNAGIVDPGTVKNIVATGLEQDRVRTSCLGFGNQYNEDLLTALSALTNGQFHDATPFWPGLIHRHSLPAILTARECQSP